MEMGSVEAVFSKHLKTGGWHNTAMRPIPLECAEQICTPRELTMYKFECNPKLQLIRYCQCFEPEGIAKLGRSLKYT
jgi:hypothetical protein